MSDDLAQKRCVPCEGGEPPLSAKQVREYLRHVPDWTPSKGGTWISHEWTFKDFNNAIGFVNRVAGLAEREGHHPDIRVFSYRRVRIDLSTHAIKGLSVNDFILAAKINALRRSVQRGRVRP